MTTGEQGRTPPDAEHYLDLSGIEEDSPGPHFDVVLRGYDRRQVDEHVAGLRRMNAQLRAQLAVRERRRSGGEFDAELQLEVLAVRLGGYALDACGEAAALGPGAGPTAHDTCRWLRKVEGLTDGSRELPPSLKSALSSRRIVHDQVKTGFRQSDRNRPANTAGCACHDGDG